MGEMEQLQCEVERLLAENQRLRDVLEEERTRIATEIHDGVSQKLALLILKMEIISRLMDRDPAKARAEMSNAHSILEASIEDLRRAIFSLRSMAPDG